jgi:transcriptional regulator with XRE-family HTH domain
MPKSLVTWGDHIKKRRLELGLYQKQVAKQLGVDETTVHNWERNYTRPALRFLPGIVRFLAYEPNLSAKNRLAGNLEKIVVPER